MAEILIGTCSWTDPTLIRSGRFYPDWAKSAETRLQFYASQFNLVEVDSSYYALPNEKTSRLWVERTSEGFVFDVKAFRLFTQHHTPLSALPEDIRSALPQGLKEKPGVYQRDLPPDLVNDKNRQRTIDFLRQSDLPFVCVDEPQGFQSSMLPIVEATSDIGLVRFHGRNIEMWEKKGISVAERFNYLYSEDELREWVPGIKELAAMTRQLHVLFNNCYADKAVVNAHQIGCMLA